ATLANIGDPVAPVDFFGYEQFTGVPSSVKSIVVAGAAHDALRHGQEGEVVRSPTPFYAESGGQIGDNGMLEWESGRATVLDTQKPFGDVIVSRVRVDEGHLS